MTPDIQTIRTPSGDELVVLPRAVYEDLVDARAVADARAALDAGREELLSEDEIRALLVSPTPVAFWRRKRQLSLATMANALGISEHDLIQTENGARDPGPGFFERAALVLGVPFDTIAPPPDQAE